jgi:hypothetical protein
VEPLSDARTKLADFFNSLGGVTMTVDKFKIPVSMLSPAAEWSEGETKPDRRIITEV